ncbi:MAG: TIGR02452 family protein, partial [Oscillospiraceae bacterium]|nr:TIGR02452 family protein [Oscillospiraceae bacterium]
MSDRRHKLIDIFRDTQVYCSESGILKDAIKQSKENTVIYAPGDKPALPAGEREGTVTVTRHRTFEAAVALHEKYPGKRIAVLNFASATNPGGGVTRGASAQEECLCRCSTLYPVLDTGRLRSEYYSVNRAKHDALHDDTCIYSPGIVICKTDDDSPKRVKKDDFVTVDVITCAAPNLRDVPANEYNPETGGRVQITPERLFALHLSRAEHIMHTAAHNGADILIIGAFGCGAFRNDPRIVAMAYC